MSAEPLSDRRDTLCLNFMKRTVKGGQHEDIFMPKTGSNMTRSSNQLIREYTCNTQRYFNSPLVYLSRLYNQSLKK